MTALYDQTITADERVELNALLDSSTANRQLYLRYVSLHHMLSTNVGKQKRVEAQLLVSELASLPRTEQDEIDTRIGTSADLGSHHARLGRHAWRRFAAVAIAASLIITALAPGVLTRNRIGETAQQSSGDEAIDTSATSRAQITYISSAVIWREPDVQLEPNWELPIGKVLALASGEVELTYSTGTKLLLIGPAEFVVCESGGTLHRGGLVASVTEEGHGFTIDTPNGKVVDLGTEFGVAVDDFGVSEVNVFQGKVEAFPLSHGSDAPKYELTKGRGLQWNQDDLVEFDADIRRFASTVVQRQLKATDDDGQTSLIDRFRDAELDLQSWQSRGDVLTTEHGLRFRSSSEFGVQPLLLTNEDFDPALGALTIICDFRFEGPIDEPLRSFSILTRCLDEPSTAPEPWDRTLASHVRCSFGTAQDSSQGKLQIGAKLEADRELSSTSWHGFRNPVPGVNYRGIIRDDGVNVAFTVQQQDEPTVSKTVTCKSLFRGKRNFVVLESSGTGELVVEQLKIAQQRPAELVASYQDLSQLLSSEFDTSKTERELLDAWVPSGAKLLVGDDFSEGNLNSKAWTTLGDVKVSDGLVQLGLPNDEGKIDTWKARPYLLTREALNPKDGELTILGRIRFSDNFLAGYGASFAVMTRANDRHGSGPGWQNSILQRGIRVNFWPASWDVEHSLEIHEKPDRNTLSLLATQGMDVDPAVRSYLFRVVDDGETVTLTLLDPSRPELARTISSPTNPVIRNGVVGFESCWGSPIELDDVRIYQAN